MDVLLGLLLMHLGARQLQMLGCTSCERCLRQLLSNVEHITIECIMSSLCSFASVAPCRFLLAEYRPVSDDMLQPAEIVTAPFSSMMLPLGFSCFCHELKCLKTRVMSTYIGESKWGIYNLNCDYDFGIWESFPNPRPLRTSKPDP